MNTPRRIVRRTPPRTETPLFTMPIVMRPLDSVWLDPKNPRQADPARMGLLKLSLAKLGFIQPLVALPNGMLLSGHQRTTAAKAIGITHVPVITLDIPPEQQQGFNILANRAINDFRAFDTGSSAAGRLDMAAVIAAAEALPDFPDHMQPLAVDCKLELLAPLLKHHAAEYDKKGVNAADALARLGVDIPMVVSASGTLVNGLYRGFNAAEKGKTHYPVIRIPDDLADVATQFLNYLSMDFHVDADFANLLRAGAYRRPQNNRGTVPKAMRFWANGERVLPDRDSYTPEYFATFRETHGERLLDFGAGLGKVAPYLNTKGFQVLDFEPYRIDPEAGNGVPSLLYSRQCAQAFLKAIADPARQFDSIFLNSVLNSVPFAKDRLMVLAIVHALAGRNATVYGTCRDISDFNYEYQGIRQANYFTFDSEPGVRIGDVQSNPKLQWFASEATARDMFSRFWRDVTFWPGGNVFYFRLRAAKTPNYAALATALKFEFDLPFKNGGTLGLPTQALQSFAKRLSFPGLTKL